MIRIDTISPSNGLRRYKTKKLGKFMLAHRLFVTEAGKLTTEGIKMETEIARRTSAIESLGPTPSPKKKAGGRNHLRVT
jgi:hypothetical protein